MTHLCFFAFAWVIEPGAREESLSTHTHSQLQDSDAYGGAAEEAQEEQEQEQQSWSWGGFNKSRMAGAENPRGGAAATLSVCLGATHEP